MKAWLKELKQFRHLFLLMIIVGIFYGMYFYYYFSPTTNNAFIVANIRPVAAQVSGNISKIYIKNGSNVIANQKLFKIDDTPFKLKILEIKSILKSAKYKLTILESESQNKAVLNNKLIAKVKIQNQQQFINTLQIKLQLAEYKLSNTIVYAQEQGIISNMYLSKGYPVIAFKPLFSFVDTSQYWVQANFKETDLGKAKANQKANITLRMYGSQQVFKGVIVSLNWAVDRQLTNNKTQLPVVESENQWTLMPQRFPVLIKILNSNKNYPLHVGASAYVTLIRK